MKKIMLVFGTRPEAIKMCRNGTVGNVSLYECTDCVVHAGDARKVVLQGLDGYIVSEKNGQILVCRRSEEQRIREFSAKL